MKINKLSLILILLYQIPIHANEGGIYLLMNSFSYSESTSIRAISGAWDDDIDNGTTALSHSSGEVGFTHNHFSLGLVDRYDYQYQFKSETIEVLDNIYNDNLLISNKNYPLYIDADSLTRHGVKFGYLYDAINDLQIQISGLIMKGDELVNGEITGLAYRNNGINHIAFDIDYIYTEEVLFNRKFIKPDSIGYALDLGVNWRVTEKMNIDLNIHDLYSRMKWFNAPATEARVDSDYRRYDENGYRQVFPAATGKDSYRDYTQTIQPKFYLNSDYKLNNSSSLLLKYSYYPLASFIHLGYGHHFNQVNVMFSIEPKNKIIEFGFGNNTNRISFAIDDVEINKAHAIGFDFKTLINF